eukprot:RCo019403
MGCLRLRQSTRLTSMLVLNGSFMVVELVVGHTTHCNALTADAFHMLSDVFSVLIALLAVRFGAKPEKYVSDRYSFGWARAELVGALVNSVFLVALSFDLVIQAAMEFYEGHTITSPELLLVTGSIGLLINLIGLCVLHDGHGHSHGHCHGHGHGHGHGHDHVEADTVLAGETSQRAAAEESSGGHSHGHGHGQCHGHGHGHGHG